MDKSSELNLMNSGSEEPDEAHLKRDDFFKLSGTERDLTEEHDSSESTVEITAIFDKYHDEGYDNSYDPGYYTFKDKYLMNSDRASVGTRVSKKGVPSWIYVFMMLAGVIVLGVSGYFIVQDQMNAAEAQVAPVPEEEDLFDANSTVTYTGPSQHEVDWESEFAKIDYENSGNLGGVVVPSLDMHSELVATDAAEGSLILPDAPLGTWYERTAEIGADTGNSILAGHVNHRTGSDFSPWAHLHESERGMLMGVRDHDGEIHVYEFTDMSIYSRQAVPEEYFRTDGDHQIHLVTCSGEILEDPDDLGGRYFENNLIVSAELVETI